MPRQMKANACLIFALAGVFYLFWQVCKQQPALAHVNAFANDPYDAVGSFSTQFALFSALLVLLCAFRPYQALVTIDEQQQRLTHVGYITCVSIAITLIIDGIALLRFPSVWIGLSAGYLLVAFLGGMVLLTVLVAWRIHVSSGRYLHRVPLTRRLWMSAVAFSLLLIIVFGWYPEYFTTFFLGELVTILLSVFLFFASVRVWNGIISPIPDNPAVDTLDDLGSFYSWLKAHAGPFSVILSAAEKVLKSTLLRPIVNWLNPRSYPWNGVLLVGMIMGMILALAEAMGEGGFISIRIAVLFASIECCGVLIGYVFMAKPLGLFRHKS